MTFSLFELSHQGIFPGPKEPEEVFLVRAQALSGQAGSATPCLLQELFGCVPNWVDVTTESKGLRFWEGAALWIQEGPDGGRTCQIQLKDSFLTRFYPKEEILAHEKVHAMRLMFDEKRFEEILAYQTSKSAFRRYFGPLFSSPRESTFLMGLLLFSWLQLMIEELCDWSLLGGWIFLFPLLILGKTLYRLIRSQRIFNAARCRLQELTSNPLTVMLRLTDTEIERFAKATAEEICVYAKTEQSVRWKQLHPLFTLAGRRDV